MSFAHLFISNLQLKIDIVGKGDHTFFLTGIYCTSLDTTYLFGIFKFRDHGGGANVETDNRSCQGVTRQDSASSSLTSSCLSCPLWDKCLCFQGGDEPYYVHHYYLTLTHNMALNGATVGYSYAPSGSTIELIDLTTTSLSSRPLSRVSSARSKLSWHPKLTLYRLLVIFSTVGLAAAKTATTCLNFTFASITLEWVLGVVVFLL